MYIQQDGENMLLISELAQNCDVKNLLKITNCSLKLGRVRSDHPEYQGLTQVRPPLIPRSLTHVRPIGYSMHLATCTANDSHNDNLSIGGGRPGELTEFTYIVTLL